MHIELDNGETIAFVSCHLAAHEKPKFLQARNDMVPEIFNGARGDCQLRRAAPPSRTSTRRFSTPETKCSESLKAP